MSPSSFETWLLESGRRDRPARDRRVAARAAFLGAASSAAVVLTAADAAAAGKVAATKLILLKIGMAALLVGGGVGAVAVAARGNSAAGSAEDSAPLVVVRAPNASSFAVPPVVPSSIEERSAEVSPRVEVPRAPSALPRASVERASGDTLAEEIEILKPAQQCLRAHDEACASEHVRTYRRRFGASGRLADEASLIEIEAARERHDDATARNLAESFLAQRGESVYAPRVRATLGK